MNSRQLNERILSIPARKLVHFEIFQELSILKLPDHAMIGKANKMQAG